MKIIMQCLVGALFLPLIVLGYVAAFLRVIFTLTFVFVWERSENTYMGWFCKVNDYIQYLNKKQ